MPTATGGLTKCQHPALLFRASVAALSMLLPLVKHVKGSALPCLRQEAWRWYAAISTGLT